MDAATRRQVRSRAESRCEYCGLGPNLTGIDPQPAQIIPLFHPRTQLWHEHFALQDTEILGLTPTGRTTVRFLAMNADIQRQLRAQLR
jgi:hypothetical protein